MRLRPRHFWGRVLPGAKARRERDGLADAGFEVLHERDVERATRRRLEALLVRLQPTNESDPPERAVS
jgi:hypothetical protein